MASVEVSVLGGLLIEVEYEVYPAEPDVGIMSSYAEPGSIVAIAGRPLRRKESTAWIEKRLSKHDEDAIAEACNEAASGW